MKKNKIIVFLLLVMSCQNAQIDKEKLTGNDFRLFQDTPVWKLAQAVEDENIIEIERLLKEDNLNLDFQDCKFGNTLLMLAVRNNKYLSAEKLLLLGANPNKHDNYRGSTPTIWSARNKDIKYLNLILKNGGDPNSKENSDISKTLDNTRTTVLNTTISLSDSKTLEKVKLLVDAGANINYSQSDTFETPSPLSNAIVHKKLDVAFYLLKEGADFKKPLYKMVDGHEVYILEALRKIIVDLNTQDFKDKKGIINFLEKKGLEYEREPIPGYVLKDIKEKYPNNWESYSKSY